MVFENPFFSFAGQAERLGNVANTLKSALTLKGVQANTGNKTADVVLGSLASNPYLTALPGAKIGGVTIATSVASKAVSAFQGAKFTTQALVVGGGIFGANALAKSPTLVEGVVNTPSNLANFGENIGEFVEEPSIGKAKEILLENPVIAGATAGAIAIASGASLGTVASIIATKENTDAIRDSTAQLPFVPTQTTKSSAGAVAPVLTDELTPSKTDTSATVPAVASSEKTNRISNKIQIINQTKASISAHNRKIYIHKRRRRS